MSDVPTLDRDTVRELDRRAIEEHGIASIVLMENAGRRCADEAARIVGDASAGAIVVLCGPGNNGGDGFVIARTLRNRGFDVELYFVGDPASIERASADVQQNARLWRDLGGEVSAVEESADLDALTATMMESALVVDALFGTGLTRPLAGVHADVVLALRASERPTLAVDLPSGLDANTGAVLGAAVRADVTVTFIAAKPGFYVGEGPACCGRVIVAEIGIPAALIEEALFE